MGVKERKEREKQDMRELILKAAHQIFVDKSFEEVSIRNIADEIEYSPATIYLYFKDKNEIFYALHTEAFKVFNQYVAEIMTIANPFDRLVAMGRKYMAFARKYPKYYDIMFITKAPMDCHLNKDKWEEGTKAHCFLEALVEQCQKAGHFKGLDVKILSLSIWSYTHGLCSLELQNRLRIYPDEDQYTITRDSFEQFIKILKTL
jgi:AcrR family transcriptional regulator